MKNSRCQSLSHCDCDCVAVAQPKKLHGYEAKNIQVHQALYTSKFLDSKDGMLHEHFCSNPFLFPKRSSLSHHFLHVSNFKFPLCLIVTPYFLGTIFFQGKNTKKKSALSQSPAPFRSSPRHKPRVGARARSSSMKAKRWSLTVWKPRGGWAAAGSQKRCVLVLKRWEKIAKKLLKMLIEVKDGWQICFRMKRSTSTLAPLNPWTLGANCSTSKRSCTKHMPLVGLEAAVCIRAGSWRDMGLPLPQSHVTCVNSLCAILCKASGLPWSWRPQRHPSLCQPLVMQWLVLQVAWLPGRFAPKSSRLAAPKPWKSSQPFGWGRSPAPAAVVQLLGSEL